MMRIGQILFAMPWSGNSSGARSRLGHVAVD
jgi:hypothetical protein